MEANFVSTSGLDCRPNLRIYVCSWPSFGRLSQICKRAKQFCSAALLRLVVLGSTNVYREQNCLVLEGKWAILIQVSATVLFRLMI